MRRLLVCVCLCACLAAAIPAFASNITVGLPADPGTGNCFPFGCAYSGEYQQVYTHSLFSGPITITALEFFNTQYDSGATSMNMGNWTISLSESSHDWNTLSSTFSQNIGANNQQVFSGNLNQPWMFGDTLIVPITPYTYDPAAGNLLMDVQVSGASDPNGAIYFDTNGYNNGGDNGNTIFGRVYGSGTVNAGYGLVTGFETQGGTTPEPSSLLLLGSGLVTVGAVVRRKIRL